MEEFNWLAEYNETDWVDVAPATTSSLPNPPNDKEEMVAMSESDDEFDPSSLLPAPPTEGELPPAPEQSSSISSTAERRSQRMVVLDEEDSESEKDDKINPAIPATTDVVGTREEEWSE